MAEILMDQGPMVVFSFFKSFYCFEGTNQDVPDEASYCCCEWVIWPTVRIETESIKLQVLCCWWA